MNLAAGSWRDENGHTWLERAPKITLLPLLGHQREPQPISWADQRTLLPKLPHHLSRMALFVLNTGVRDDVVCSLRRDWEIRIPELGISVSEVPRQHVKGKKRSKIVVCNSVAQSVIESVRGMHEEFVFVYRRERVKNVAQAPVMAYRRIETMNNTAWQRARKEAGLGDLHVHDLRHTVGMRLREAGVPEGTRADPLAQHAIDDASLQRGADRRIVEVHAALEKVKDDTGRWNKSLLTLRREQEEARGELSPPKVPQQQKAA
jgi:integrase